MAPLTPALRLLWPAHLARDRPEVFEVGLGRRAVAVAERRHGRERPVECAHVDGRYLVALKGALAAPIGARARARAEGLGLWLRLRLQGHGLGRCARGLEFRKVDGHPGVVVPVVAVTSVPADCKEGAAVPVRHLARVIPGLALG